jgi:hypothetical protein
MQYSYLNTADHSESVNDLWLFIIHYVTCVVNKLSQRVKFQSLLKKADLLVRNLIKQMLKRLN